MQEKGKTAYLDPTCGEGEILMQLKKEIIGASKVQLNYLDAR